MNKTFEEYRVISQPAAWTFLVLLAASILAWGVFIQRSVPDTPRTHHYGTLPDTPGQSIYSTSRTREGTDVPRQMQPLPEAQSPHEKIRNSKSEIRNKFQNSKLQTPNGGVPAAIVGSRIWPPAPGSLRCRSLCTATRWFAHHVLQRKLAGPAGQTWLSQRCPLTIMTRTPPFGIWDFVICDLFRISDFEFRILATRDARATAEATP